MISLNLDYKPIPTKPADVGVQKMTIEQWLYANDSAEVGVGDSPTALKLLRSNADWVYACVTLIADRISDLAVEIYRGDREVEGHAFLDLLNNPNPVMSRRELLHHMVQSLLLTGNAFWFVDFAGGKKPAALFPLSVDKVTLEVQETTWLASYYYLGQRLEPKQVVHFRLPNPANLFYGFSPVQAAAYAHDISLYSQIYQKNFFRNNARPDYIVFLPQSLSGQRSAQEIWNQIQDRHQGYDKAHLPLILGHGASVTPLTVSSADSRYLDATNATRDKILGVFRVPAAKLGLTTDSNRSNSDAADYTFNRDSIKPRASMIADAMTGLLRRFWEPDAEFWFEDPVVSDEAADRAEEQFYLEYGIISRNDVREKLGLGPVPGGEVLLVKQGLIPADMAGASIQAGIDMRQALIEKPKPEETQQTVEQPEVSPPDPKSLATSDLVKAIKAPGAMAELWDRYVKKLDPAEKSYKSKISDYFRAQAKRIMPDILAVYERETAKVNRSYTDKAIRSYVKALDVTSNVQWDSESAEFEGMSLEEIKGSIQAAMKSTLEDLRSGRVDSVMTDKMRRWAENRSGKLASVVSETTKDAIDNIVKRALMENRSVSEVQAMILAKYEQMAEWRAQAIARTEMNGAMNYGTLEGYRESGVVAQKQWLPAFDERVRSEENGDEFDHTTEEIADVDAPFLATGEPLDHPGDPAGSPANTINCRCTTIPIVDETMRG